MSEHSYIDLYLEYTRETECATLFNRWTAISNMAAWLGRRVYFPFGTFKIHANMYIMFVGLAGTKKSTAIKIGQRYLKSAGYKHFAANKTRQEKFLLDLAEAPITSQEVDILDVNLFGDEPLHTTPVECYVAADEVNNFIGVGNLEFMSILGDLWDYDDVFKYRLKNSDSVELYYPTINILSGNTYEGFSRLFPPEAIGTGFFSRMIFVNAPPTDIKYTIMPTPDEKIDAEMNAILQRVKTSLTGAMPHTPAAYEILDLLYRNVEGVPDMRFDAYNNRRLTHLIKLCMVVAASRESLTVDAQDVIYANTILTYTEHFMPKALGEFGKARSSGASHKVMDIINRAGAPITVQAIWKEAHQDLDSRQQLFNLLGDLQLADKIQPVEGGAFLPKNTPIKAEQDLLAVDWSLLTEAERELI